MCVIVKPMIGDWAVPRIERIGTVDRRRLARLSVPGLAGDLHHDLGSHSVAVDIEGSLQGDEERDEFLQKVRANLLTGDPLTFVADITTATELELVVIEGLEVEEVNDAARSFRYRIRVRQYVEPPEPRPWSTTWEPTSHPSWGSWPTSGSRGSSCPTCWATSPPSAIPHRRCARRWPA
jgi:hypothetical protein